jgi:hypothetical protein
MTFGHLFALVLLIDLLICVVLRALFDVFEVVAMQDRNRVLLGLAYEVMNAVGVLQLLDTRRV